MSPDDELQLSYKFIHACLGFFICIYAYTNMYMHTYNKYKHTTNIYIQIYTHTHDINTSIFAYVCIPSCPPRQLPSEWY